MRTNPIYGFPRGVRKGERYSRGKLKDIRPQKKTHTVQGHTKASAKGICAEVSKKCKLRGHSERARERGEGGEKAREHQMKNEAS